MKTREEQRMMLAGMAMQGILANDYRGREYENTPLDLGGMALCAVSYADALLAELDRTAPKPETPIPDADGWIPHRPGDAMPCDGGTVVSVKHCDGTISHGDTAQFWECGDSGVLDSAWTGTDDDPDMQIIAWKPAK